MQRSVQRIEGEFWTSRQRQGHSLHEVSYRACFKPELPAYFIQRHTRTGDRVYDPFGGRGTTALEAALAGRRAISNDANPLAQVLLAPRLAPPSSRSVARRLERLELAPTSDDGPDLSMFFHPDTERQVRGLRDYLAQRMADGEHDSVDGWIRMVATTRLTGHSAGFFSVYTLPPNQAASPEAQRRINRRRRQTPPRRDVKALIIRKSKSLMRKLTADDRARLAAVAPECTLLSQDAAQTPEIGDGSVALVVTSPPFLNVVQYAADNWMRCWFNGLDARTIEARLTTPASLEPWSRKMQRVMTELHRVVRPGGVVAFEVGEVNRGETRLEETVVPLGIQAGFDVRHVMIHRQGFTKTANIWGVHNNRRGTNTHRITVFQKPD